MKLFEDDAVLEITHEDLCRLLENSLNSQLYTESEIDVGEVVATEGGFRVALSPTE